MKNIELIKDIGGKGLFVRLTIERAGNTLILESRGNTAADGTEDQADTMEIANEELINLAAEYPEVFAALDIHHQDNCLCGECPDTFLALSELCSFENFINWYQMNHA